MNIFYLDHDPVIAAQLLVDKHVTKMQSESAQMLVNCYPEEVLEKEGCPRTQKGNIRRYSYYNHPCSLWVRRSLANWRWLIDHATAMYEEKLYRTNKGHFSFTFVEWSRDNPPKLPDIGLTPPAQVFKDHIELVDYEHPVLAYRRFYVVDKRYDKNGKRMDFWTKRDRPTWFPE